MAMWLQPVVAPFETFTKPTVFPARPTHYLQTRTDKINTMFMAEAHLCNVDDNDTTSTPTRVELGGRRIHKNRQPERQAKTDQR